jgi:hypothetical protein
MVVITEGALLVAWGVLRDDGKPPAALSRPGDGGTLLEILERARDAS